MSLHSELETFDGKDNRREVMVLLQRLGSDQARADFLSRLCAKSRNGFANVEARVVNADPVAAYFMLVGICNEVGVSINEAARLLESEVRRG